MLRATSGAPDLDKGDLSRREAEAIVSCRPHCNIVLRRLQHMYPKQTYAWNNNMRTGRMFQR